MADKLAAALGPNVEDVRTDLQRRRELARLSKPALITHIRRLEILLSEADQ